MKAPPKIAKRLQSISVFSPYDGAPVGSVNATDAQEIGPLLELAHRGSEYAKSAY